MMKNLSPFIPSFEGTNILVVGDVMTDRYITGNVTRISPEAPVPIVRTNRSENRLGGAGNVALNLLAMGATPILCGMVGDDQQGKILKESLDTIGILPNYITISPFRRTTVKTRVIAQNQQLLRLDQEDDYELNKQEERDFLDVIKSALAERPIRMIIFQDYNKGLLTLRVIREIMKDASLLGIPTAADPKANNFFAYRKIGLFKPNLKEIRDRLPFPISADDITSLNRADAYIRTQLENTYTMITLSEKGIYVNWGEGSTIIPARRRAIADVCGAGDTVISTAALALSVGADVKDAAILANMAGGQVCEKVGVVPVNKAELLEEYNAAPVLSF